MKIIGTTEVPHSSGLQYMKQPGYIAVISEDEMLRVANKARSLDKLPKINVGDDYPIAEGYDFHHDLLAAIKSMQDAYTKFAAVAPLAAQFAGVVVNKAEKED